MSLYAVKNDKGEWLDWGDMGFWPKEACKFATTGNHEDADRVASDKDGHLVELIEAPAKVVVSEEEAEMLEQAKNETLQEVGVIYHYYKDHGGWRLGNDLGDRLMRAYVNGWTVEKQKRFNVKVPHVDVQEGLWLFVNSDGKVDATYYQDLAQKFTLAEIEHYGLGDCEKVEVTDDEQ